jgi:hypothetical protein
LTLGEFDSGKAQRRAARVGLGAVAMWATRGLFPAMTGENAMSGGASVPPFLLNRFVLWTWLARSRSSSCGVKVGYAM